MKHEFFATAMFAVALVHTFSVGAIARLSRRYAKNKWLHKIFHLLSEVELVFGAWAILFLLSWMLVEGPSPVLKHHSSLNLTEPLFIFCVMIMSSTRAIITLARRLIFSFSRLLQALFKFDLLTAQFFSLMTLGPLLGSVITEPAAITITALLLYRMIKKESTESKTMYSLLALLFVNISVGGALTHFAAPPILVVARTWNWGATDVFFNLGIAALATVILNNILIFNLFKKQLRESLQAMEVDHYEVPAWLISAHALFLFLLVYNSHYPMIFVPIFLAFLVLVYVTNKFQDGLKFRESWMVSFFLYGLVVFGSFQRWWIEPLITNMGSGVLYLSAAALTAVTDNAALTYLGSQVTTLSDLSKWSLTAGALVGGGLTILANAPNAAGFAVLSSKFPDSSLSAVKLFKAAILPTLVALGCFAFKIFY